MFAYNRHLKSHDRPPKIPPVKVWKPTYCEFCGKLYDIKLAYSNHKIRCPKNPNRIYQKHTEAGKERVRQANIGKTWSLEKRQRHSLIMKQVVLTNPDSYSKNNVSGRVKIIEYNGVKLKGTWELKVAMWLDQNNILWETEVNPQQYYWNASWHLYFPDFYLNDHDVYIEVKGYKTERDIQKWNQFSGNLIVVDSNSIKNLDEFLGRTHKLVSAPRS